MQGHFNRRIVVKQVVFTVTALMIFAVYAGAVFASIGS